MLFWLSIAGLVNIRALLGERATGSERIAEWKRVMQEEILASIQAVLDRISMLAREDHEFRQHLRLLGKAATALVDDLDQQDRARQTVEPPDPKVVEAVAALGDRLRDNALTTQAAALRIQAERTEERPPVEDSELRLIQERCELKVEALEWCILSRFSTEEERDPDEMEGRRRILIERAKALPDCYLWMLYPWTCNRGLKQDLENLRECFANMALMAEVLQSLLPRRDDQREFLERAVRITAEVQSALRVAVEAVGNRIPDPDQEKCFLWLRRTTTEQRVFVDRFMRWNDRADPACSGDVRSRLEMLHEEFHNVLNVDKEATQALNRARYHIKMIERSPGAAHEHDWQVVIDSIKAALQLGMHPSSVELRELLLPAMDDLPVLEQEHPAFNLVVREIERFLTSAPISPTASLAQEASPDVMCVREMLRGTTVVLIGGDSRPAAHAALKQAFELADLLWLSSEEHQSLELFRPYVARSEVALVMLAIRWSSHSFGDVKEFCDAYGKPFVRLPGGYSPNQVARQILEQASEWIQQQQAQS